MKRITLGLILILALSVISFANIQDEITSVSANKAAPVQTAGTATTPVAVVTEKQDPVKESVGQVPDAEVFNLWKPVQTLAGYRVVENKPKICV